MSILSKFELFHQALILFFTIIYFLPVEISADQPTVNHLKGKVSISAWAHFSQIVLSSLDSVFWELEPVKVLASENLFL